MTELYSNNHKIESCPLWISFLRFFSNLLQNSWRCLHESHCESISAFNCSYSSSVRGNKLSYFLILIPLNINSITWITECTLVTDGLYLEVPHTSFFVLVTSRTSRKRKMLSKALWCALPSPYEHVASCSVCLRARPVLSAAEWSEALGGHLFVFSVCD